MDNIVMIRTLLMAISGAFAFSLSAPLMANKMLPPPPANMTIPVEILSAIEAPDINTHFTGYDRYAVTFRTDPDVLAAMLPTKLSPVPNSDIAVLVLNRFYLDYLRGEQQVLVGDGTYYELLLVIPSLFESPERVVSPKRYIAQLYLGSIEPESSVLPIMGGQLIYGFPKREALFQIEDFGENQARIIAERFSSTIVNMELTLGDKHPSPPVPKKGGETTLLKAIPSVDLSGWDVLQLTHFVQPGEESRVPSEIVGYWDVDATFKGDLVLDSGQVLPVHEVHEASFRQVKGFSMWPAEVLFDYLNK